MQRIFLDTEEGGSNHRKKDRAMKRMVFGTDGKQVNIPISSTDSLGGPTPTRTKVIPNFDDMNEPTRKFTVHSNVFTSGPCTFVQVPTGTNIDASTNADQLGSQHMENTRPVSYFNIATTSSLNGSANKNEGEQDVLMVAYKSDGLSLIATKNRYPNDARFVYEFHVFGIMVVLNLDKHGYRKETIRVEYEWKPPRCSTCLVFGHSVDDCPKGNGTFFLSNSFEALNVDNMVIEDLDSGNNESTYEEGQSVTLVVEKINMIEQQLLEGKFVLVDDDGKPLEKDDYLNDHDNEDEVEPLDNEMASYLASEPSEIGYGTNSLPKQ
uniref:Zinc knuckle CX2CX4HX4C n=1 Tax=Tanacetum cinerariifolium TaxID=118510 RepID=A0A6L2MGA9_TANCI|nr:hypothetical protein [Tanacetum cinerariifolium]